MSHSLYINEYNANDILDIQIKEKYDNIKHGNNNLCYDHGIPMLSLCNNYIFTAKNVLINYVKKGGMTIQRKSSIT